MTLIGKKQSRFLAASAENSSRARSCAPEIARRQKMVLMAHSYKKWRAILSIRKEYFKKTRNGESV